VSSGRPSATITASGLTGSGSFSNTGDSPRGAAAIQFTVSPRWPH
jgi:hypothetical protein